MNAWCVSDCASSVLTRHLTLPHVHSLHCKLIHQPDVGINAKWMTYTETLFVLLSGGTDRQWEDRGGGVTKSTRSCWLFLNVALCIFIQPMLGGPRSPPSFIHSCIFGRRSKWQMRSRSVSLCHKIQTTTQTVEEFLRLPPLFSSPVCEVLQCGVQVRHWKFVFGAGSSRFLWEQLDAEGTRYRVHLLIILQHNEMLVVVPHCYSKNKNYINGWISNDSQK